MITLYTDGGNNRNGLGGAGAVIIYSDGTIETLTGVTQPATNNQMELCAFIIGAIHLMNKKVFSFKVVTDSKYLMDGATLWLYNWIIDGRLARGEVKNKNLWLIIDVIRKHTLIEWKHVKGHTGNEYNEIADKLTRSVRKWHGTKSTDKPSDYIYNIGFMHYDMSNTEIKQLLGIIENPEQNRANFPAFTRRKFQI